VLPGEGEGFDGDGAREGAERVLIALAQSAQAGSHRAPARVVRAKVV
jgi:hypothetical protein